MNNDKQEQFTKVPHYIMANKNLTDQDKLTLSIILSYINNDKDCFIGNDGLSKMLGISRNAASKRINRLVKIGYIKLRYTYSQGTKKVEKRYITIISQGLVLQTINTSAPDEDLTSTKVEIPQTTGVVPQTIPLVPQTTGVVPQTTPPRPTDDTPSSKVGGIRQGLLDNLLDNKQNNLKHKLQNNKNCDLEFGGFVKEETPSRVSLSYEDFDMYSKKYEEEAELVFQQMLNKNK